MMGEQLLYFDFFKGQLYNNIVLLQKGRIMKNVFCQTSFHSFEPVIEYVQRLCLCRQGKRD